MSPYELAAAYVPEKSSDGKTPRTLPKVMLDRSEVPYEVVFTEHAGHAYDVGADLDIDRYSAVAVIGGDCLLHELLQGLYSSSKTLSTLELLLSRLPFAIVPAGTNDGLANSLGMPNAYLACKRMLDAIYTGQDRPLDLYHAVRESSIAPDDGTETAADEESRVSEDQGCGVVDLTMTCWGFIADVEMITRRALGRFPRQVGRAIAALVSVLRMDGKAGHIVLYCKEPIPKELSGLGLPEPKTWLTTIRGPIMSLTVTNVSHAAGGQNIVGNEEWHTSGSTVDRDVYLFEVQIYG
ncbi:sphingosine kinase, putative [Perkinsus marinus ATCC 50983]|uniref:Sphingosine kinase, putative n=1 Tax=Perkinsus marinus (strain ATCC 50983 / TXsc) TaxID=423536 RepID=C5KG19_PERM5|nr:sphingosine kinase, putative [Perkinsus marinus ATCC 50983]EER16583.1 sphingosine kinase, putative [Perkinsus marinus ATCC 50983]|eukprot:XP_002784787.1 sphingosine kinase, putative [Perkinsus marinus ATCC 50983]